MSNRKEGPGSKSVPKSRTTDSAFDLWLNRGLHELFDDVMKEPIPPQLLNIVRQTDPMADSAPDTASSDRKADDHKT